MRRILLLLFLAALPANAADIYVAQASAGGNTGANCANARAASSLAAGDWTAGNSIHLCGTLTSAITAQGSGAPGNVITVVFESGAGFSFAAIPTGGALILTNRTDILVDGGGGSCGFVSFANVTCTNGFIKSTANGSGLANQVASIAIEASNTTNVEIKGLVLGPIYTHTSTSDITQSPPGPRAVYFVGATNISIHNNTIHDCGWCLNGNSTTALIQANEIYNNDHGVALGGTNSSITVQGNHFHDWVDWDTTNNSFHHDGVHFFDQAGLTFSGADIDGNLFDGDQGVNVTAAIYIEKASTGTITIIRVYNNVMKIAATRYSNVGWLAFWLTGSGTGTTASIYNNTIYGAYVPAGSGSCAGGGGPCGSCFGLTGWTSVTAKNNILTGCQNLIGVAASSSAVIDYNIYEDIGTDHGTGGSANTFTWHGSQFASFSTWKTDCSCDANGIFNTLANIKLNSSTLQPLSGSLAIGAGVNLTSLGVTPLDVDALGNARPAMTAWDIGAINGVGAGPGVPMGVSVIFP